MKRITRNLIALSLAMTSATQAFAATDGDVGNSTTGSTGVANISILVPKLIRITDMADFTFPTYNPAVSGDRTLNDDVSVSTNIRASGRTYSIEARGSGASNAFTLTDGTDILAYSVKWNQTTGTSGNAALTAGTPLTGRTGANGSLGTTTKNANIQITITESAIQGIQTDGTTPYAGTLSIIVKPE